MAIEFARTHVIGRAQGHTAIKAAAYRSGTRLHDDRIGRTADYSHRACDVAHSEILLPDGAPESLRDRATLWSAIEVAEDASTRRSTAQLAKDQIIALPIELSLEQQIALARDFAKSQFVDQGVAVDLNVHLHSEGNPHAHLMSTTRVIDADGIGKKARHLNGRFYQGRKLREEEQLRHRWADFQNAWAKERGIDLAVTNNNGEWQAELHRGPTKHMDAAGEADAESGDCELSDLGQTVDRRKVERVQAILDKPELLVNRVTSKRAYFTHQDLWRELFRHVDDPADFAAIKAKLEISDFVVPIGVSVHTEFDRDGSPKGDAQPLLTSRKVLGEEVELRGLVEILQREDQRHGHRREAAVERVRERFDFLSDEQWSAIDGITDSRRLSVVVGFAGAGKSTMLDAARSVWESSGYRVRGLAPSGKAAEGLEASAHFGAQTLHSFISQFERGKSEIRRDDVFVIDEAGMVNTSVMLKVVRHIEAAGAKVVLVGDPEQLQPIQAGNPLRTIATRSGYHEISTIRRQCDEWQQQATFDLARGDVEAGWEAYASRGCVHKLDDRDAAIAHLADRFVADYAPDDRRQIALAYSRKDVQSLNEQIRERLIAAGRIDPARGQLFGAQAARIDIEEPDALPDLDRRREADEALTFAPGDRVVFNKNDSALGVKNGSFGTVIEAARNRLRVQVDEGRAVEFSAGDYAEVSRGFAATVHKSQGITVDDAHVLITRGWNKHLAYVAMSRHRDTLSIYSNRHSFHRGDEAKVLGEADRQQSVIDLAESHGFEFDESGQRFVALDADRLRARGESAQATLRLSVRRRMEDLRSDDAKARARLADAAEHAREQCDAHERLGPVEVMSAELARRWVQQLDRLHEARERAESALAEFDQVIERRRGDEEADARRWAMRQHPKAVADLKAWRRSEAEQAAMAASAQSTEPTASLSDDQPGVDGPESGESDRRVALDRERRSLLAAFDESRDRYFEAAMVPIEEKVRALSDAEESLSAALAAHAAKRPEKRGLGHKGRVAQWRAEYERLDAKLEAARVEQERYAQLVREELRPQAMRQAEADHRDDIARIRELGEELAALDREQPEQLSDDQLRERAEAGQSLIWHEAAQIKAELLKPVEAERQRLQDISDEYRRALSEHTNSERPAGVFARKAAKAWDERRAGLVAACDDVRHKISRFEIERQRDKLDLKAGQEAMAKAEARHPEAVRDRQRWQARQRERQAALRQAQELARGRDDGRSGGRGR